MPKTVNPRNPMHDPAYKERRVYSNKQQIQRGDPGSSVDVEIGNGVPNMVDKDNHPSSVITKKARHRPRRKKYSSDLNSQVTPGEWKTKGK